MWKQWVVSMSARRDAGRPLSLGAGATDGGSVSWLAAVELGEASR